jgi:aspartate/methionine/tyrosine aminotransferase
MQQAARLEAAGHDILHLEVGEPDFPTAEAISAAGAAALGAGHTGYTQAAGLPALREALSEHYRRQHGLKIGPERILITPGASGALSLLAQLLLNPGDRVLMSDPAYPCNRNFVRLAGAEPKLVPVNAAQGWELSTAALDAAVDSSTVGLWLASPANPTGAVIGRDQLAELCHWARGQKLHVLVDEIYHGLAYDGNVPSVLEVDDEAIVVNSFSKYFGMTGWRLGWMVLPESLLEAATILQQNLFIAAPTMAQYAALRALDPDVREVLEQRRELFRRRRDFLLPALRSIGFDVPCTPQGAFYIHAGIGRFGDDSEEFCRRLLEAHGLALTPGADFGEHGAQQHVRFAFTTGMESLERAVARLQRALG